MKFIQSTSLEHIAVIKIAATLFNEDDVKDLLSKSYIPSCMDFNKKWVKIEAIIIKKVAKLPLPKQMKEKILCFIRPVCFQISKWRQFHYMCYNLTVDLPNEFYWMPQGIIDEKKTAEVMIKDENINVTTRYTLACIYCLEDDIKMLWDKMPESSRKSFYSQESPKHVMQNELVVFWTYHIKGEVDKMDSMIEEGMDSGCSTYQYVFQLAANGGNRVATEYFLQKLTSMEKEKSLVETAISVPFVHLDCFNDSTGLLGETYSHIFCFLLSELNEEQQIKIFKPYPHLVLTCFLDWPLQIFFMKTANLMWNFLDKDTYCEFLLNIIRKIVHGYKDFDYLKLFGEFWEQSPNDYKKHVFSVGFDRRIISDLFKIRNKNNIKLIFRYATPKDKKHLIYADNAQDICKELMNGNQLSLLKYFIKECLPSNDEVIKFKEGFENGALWHKNEYLMSNWQQKFLCVLDDIICEFQKRKCEEGDSSKAKRMCCEEFNDIAHSAEN